MKKLALLALVVLLIPGVAKAACTIDGDIFFHPSYGFPGGVEEIYAGQILTYDFALCVYTASDTLCIYGWSANDWEITGDIDDCWFDADWDGNGCYGFWAFSVECPCEAEICDYDTVHAILAYCDENVCDHDSACMADYMEQIFHVVEAPPALYVIQDTLTNIDEGQSTAYVPFAVCNGDPCASPKSYGYSIKSLGYIGTVVDTADTVDAVGGGDCNNVYAIMDASGDTACTYDTLVIIAWSVDTPYVYDTCVQVVHVIEPVPVPLFTAPVVTILVLAMILATAVFMKRRATSKA
jgi:hypothetical protein